VPEFLHAMVCEDFTNSMSIDSQGSSHGSLDGTDSGASWRPNEDSSVPLEMASSCLTEDPRPSVSTHRWNRWG
jgi:hypothetical protein